MLRPDPAVLRRLVDEYEALTGAEGARGPGELDAGARDLAYTLCVSTGTRDVQRALQAARQWLAAAPAPAPEPAAPASGQRMPTPEPA